MSPLGTSENPLRVAVIGSGPAGFYTVQHLFQAKDLAVEVDMYDRLPTPFGLVRAGVAPRGVARPRQGARYAAVPVADLYNTRE